MSATLTERRVEQDNGTTPPMLHWIDVKRPGLWSLCGKELKERVPDATEAECVVCEGMRRARP